MTSNNTIQDAKTEASAQLAARTWDAIAHGYVYITRDIDRNVYRPVFVHSLKNAFADPLVIACAVVKNEAVQEWHALSR